MLGAVILLFVMIVVFPAALLFLPGMVVSAVEGWLASDDAEARYEGTEWVDIA